MPKSIRRGVLLMATLLVAGLLATATTSAAEASVKPGVRLYSNQQQGSFFRHGSGRVGFAVRAVPCRGFAAVRVHVDGVWDRTIALRRSALTTYWTRTRYAAGRHKITFTYLRDKRVLRKDRVLCDRRITVGRVRLTRAMPSTSPPPAPSPPTTPAPVPVPGDGDDAFTLVVLGDTQNEVYPDRTTFGTRTAWLAAHKAAEDIRFVAQTGDLVSFGWRATGQYAVAAAAMKKLTDAGIPWQVTAGNHDTRAVGSDGVVGSTGLGGSAWVYNSLCRSTDFGLTPTRACVTSDSNALLRRADELTQYLPVNPSGATTSGVYTENAATAPNAKSFSSFATFGAAGREWLVLNLELWPRRDVMTWAQGVIASHPDHNVIIQTHDYLTGGGGIAGNGGYGNLPATAIRDELVAPNPNVKLVLSGHEGLASAKTFTYGDNKVVAYLGNESRSVGVTRLVDINVRTGVVSSRWWAGTADLDTAPSGRTSDSGFTFR